MCGFSCVLQLSSTNLAISTDLSVVERTESMSLRLYTRLVFTALISRTTNIYTGLGLILPETRVIDLFLPLIVLVYVYYFSHNYL